MPDFARRLRRCGRGSAAIEFAILMPILLTVGAAIVEFGAAFKVHVAVNRVASQFALAWADCSDYPTGTCGTELSSFSSGNTVSNIAPQLVPANVTLQMFEVQMKGTAPIVVYVYPAGASLNPTQAALAQATFADKQVGVIVTVSYQHSLAFFSSVMSPFLGSQLSPSNTVAQLKS